MHRSSSVMLASSSVVAISETHAAYQHGCSSVFAVELDVDRMAAGVFILH